MKIKWLICYIYAGGLGPARACSLVIQSRVAKDELEFLIFLPSPPEFWETDICHSLSV